MSLCETDRHPRGVALVIAMLIMAILLLAGTTFLTISSTESQIANNQQVSSRATLLAETGLQRAIAKLNADANYGGEASLSLGGGTVTIGVSASSQQVCLSRDLDVVASISVRGGIAQTNLRVTVDRAAYPFQWAAFAANGNLNLVSLSWWTVPQSVVDSFDSRLGAYSPANSGSGGNIGSAMQTVLYYANVQGGIMGPAWISPATGTSLGSSVEVSFPSLPEPSVAWAADPNLAENATLNLPAGTYYHTSLTLGASSRIVPAGGPVTIYVQGNVAAGNGVTLGSSSWAQSIPSSPLTIITKSGAGSPANFKAGSNFQLFGAIFGTNTNIVLGDNSTLYGSIIGRRIAGPEWGSVDEPLYNNVAPTIHYDRAVAKLPICSNSFTIRPGSWREVYP